MINFMIKKMKICLIFIGFFFYFCNLHAKDILVSGFERSDEWVGKKGDKGGEIKFSISSIKVKEGKYSGVLAYDFTGTVGINGINPHIAPTISQKLEKFKKLSLWLYGDNSKHRVILVLKDSKGEYFQYIITELKFRGWRKFEINPSEFRANWGYKGEFRGIIRFPLQIAKIVVAKSKKGNRKKGEIYIDELRIKNSGGVGKDESNKKEDIGAEEKLKRAIKAYKDIGNWRAQPGEKGGDIIISLSSKKKKEGKNALKIKYDFSKIKSLNKVNPKVFYKISQMISEKEKNIKIWVYGDNSKNRLFLILKDSKKEEFKYPLGKINYKGWKEIKININKPVDHMRYPKNGKNAGKIEYPLYFGKIILTPTKEANKKKGEIYIVVPFLKEKVNYVEKVDIKKVSKVKERNKAYIGCINGRAVYYVDNKPFLLIGGKTSPQHCFFRCNTTERFFQAIKEMNGTTIFFPIAWSVLEVEKDKYNFDVLEWFIRKSEEYGLKLVVGCHFSDVCGKIYEGKIFPPERAYVPDYILFHPEIYQWVIPHLRENSPTLCPNNSKLLEREKKMLYQLLNYLKKYDINRTVIGLQLDNEILYEGQHIRERCHCKRCNLKYKERPYVDGKEFMYESYGRYIKELSDLVAEVYDLPCFLNIHSSWMDQKINIYQIFLDSAPNLDFLGADVITTIDEPNLLSDSRVGRNKEGFVIESPTEGGAKPNLDVLPWYTIIKFKGFGFTIWDSPYLKESILWDKKAYKRFKLALYPLKYAGAQIAKWLGTENFVGWYNNTKLLKGRIANIEYKVKNSKCGALIKTGKNDITIAIVSGEVYLRNKEKKYKKIKVENGYWDGDKWKKLNNYSYKREKGWIKVKIDGEKVVKVKWGKEKEIELNKRPGLLAEMDIFNNWAILKGENIKVKVSLKNFSTEKIKDLKFSFKIGKNTISPINSLKISFLNPGKEIIKNIKFHLPKDINLKEENNYPFICKIKYKKGREDLELELNRLIRIVFPLEVEVIPRSTPFYVENKQELHFIFKNIGSKAIKGQIEWIKDKEINIIPPVKDFFVKGNSKKIISTLLRLPRKIKKYKFSMKIRFKEGKKVIKEKDIGIEWIKDLAGLWKFALDPEDKGIDEGWYKKDFNDEEWDNIKVPDKWESQGYTQKLTDIKAGVPYNGYAWYRKKIFIPSEWKGKKIYIFFGGIDDYDWTFFNGKNIGNTEGWKKIRKYRIPKELIKFGAENTIAVRVYDYQGGGGIYAGPVALWIE